MLFKERKAYTYWLKLYRKISKPERFGIGERVDKLFLELLDLTRIARFIPAYKKLPYIEESIGKLDEIKFFAEIAWENKLMETKEYALFLEHLQNIGLELGGWRKGLNKNSRSL